MIPTNDKLAYLYTQVGGCAFNPAIHKIVECPWIEAVRRITREPKFFMYYHLQTRNYVLATWLLEPNRGDGPGLMDELEIFGVHPDRIDSDPHNYMSYGMAERPPSMDMVRMLVKMKNPNPEAEYLAELDQKMYEEAVKEEESERQLQEVIKYYDQKPNPVAKKTAEQLSRGTTAFVGEIEGGEQLKLMREAMGA
jgi:hypothetical protein